MAKEIKRLPEFIEAAGREFTEIIRKKSVTECQEIKHPLGERVCDVKNGLIDEDEYISKWGTLEGRKAEVKFEQFLQKQEELLKKYGIKICTGDDNHANYVYSYGKNCVISQGIETSSMRKL